MSSGDTIPVHEGLFTSPDDDPPHLIGGRCRACERHHFPKVGTCPYCSAEQVDEAQLSRQGTLWAWTAVTSRPPGYHGEVPYGFGVVELPEGLRLVTRLTEPEPERLRFGQAMRLEVVPLHTDGDGRAVTTYAFAPVADGWP
jgi:uncharacterized OB-fold protein